MILRSGAGVVLLLFLCSMPRGHCDSEKWNLKRRPSTDEASVSHGLVPTQSARVFVIEDEKEARRLAVQHATGNKELILTTFSLTNGEYNNSDAVHLIRHLWESLNRVGRLENSIVLSYSLHTCQVLLDHGIPCFLDRYTTQPEQLTGLYKEDSPHVYQKFAWAAQLVTWGFTVNAIEADQVLLQDPLAFYNSYNDIEGLSMWNRPEVPDALGRFTGSCGKYHLEKQWNGGVHLVKGPWEPAAYNSYYHINACISTGFMFLQANKFVQQFLTDFLELMLHWRDWQPAEDLWNEVIMSYIIGSGSKRQLQVSILDAKHFSDFEVRRMRIEQGLPTDTVMLHAGSHETYKQREDLMKQHGHWLADYWNATASVKHMENLEQNFALTLPADRHTANYSASLP